MSDPRRRLPAVDVLLALADVAPLLATQPRSVVVRAARDTLDAARAHGGEAPAAGWGSSCCTPTSAAHRSPLPPCAP